MKMKKKLMVLLTVIAVTGIFMMNKVQAAQNIDWTVGVKQFRTGTTPEGMSYAIGDIKGNTSTGDPTGAILWDIVRYTSSDHYEQLNNFYCIKAGVGFSNIEAQLPYNRVYDVKKEREAIRNLANSTTNNAIKSVMNGDQYNNLMALADLVYLRGQSSEEYKKKLVSDALEAKGDHLVNYGGVVLTEDDIEAVQQAAIWYFTNYLTGNEELYNKKDKSGWLTYNLTSNRDSREYIPLASNPENGEFRNKQAEALYQYLINTAIANGQSGKIDNNTIVTLYTNADLATEVQPIVKIERTDKKFDLALRKYVTKVDGTSLSGENSRVPTIDQITLKSDTTATYKHRKDPVFVKTGSVVTYEITIYNEGEKTGRATKVVDQLATGLTFSKINNPGFQATYDETTNQVTMIRKADNITNLEAYQEGNLKSETIEIECIVNTKPHNSDSKILTNVAWIAEAYDSDGGVTITNQTGEDRDSTPSIIPNVNKDNMESYKGITTETDLSQNKYYPGQEDDDDFEKLILAPQAFDLKLIKRIVQINGVSVPERIESVDVSKLNTIGKDGTKITTADYKVNKDPVSVKKGDIIKYTFRVYNEGDMDGYAQEISEDIPEGLEFLWSEKTGTELEDDTTLTQEEKKAVLYNQGIWDIKNMSTETGRIEMIKTDYLAKGKGAEIATDGANLIKAFDASKGYINTVTEKNPDYKEVSVYLKVISDNTTGTVIRNEAAITEDADKEGNPVEDRDSNPDEWVKYEDDEDYDNIKLQVFDLALRKFIIAVSDSVTPKEEDYLKSENGSYIREPQVDTSKLNTTDENGKMITTATYNQTKEPVEIHDHNIVIYMLRVYNEGEIDGYASQIKDYLPPYLEFVEGEFNEKYGWKISEDGRIAQTNYLDNHIIKKAQTDNNGKIILSYKEIPIMCKVKDTAVRNENITNIAEVSIYKDENKQTVNDRDSNSNNINLPSDEELPTYKEDEKGSYIPGQEDDDDFEKVKLTYFDLALRKWVTQAIVIEDGKETITQTGHKPEDDPEEVVKVELNRKKLSKITVKFRYSIRVTNEGDIAGYVKEITDYIPEGLKFVAKDNPGWTDEGNNIVSTKLLENTLLQPGEYVDVEILLTWINDKENLGTKINTAEISEDYNNKDDVPDIDSTPDNQKPGEDDIDTAPVILSIATGQEEMYFALGLTILITIAGGIILIRKFVL